MRHPACVALLVLLCCACGCLALADGASPAAVVQHLPRTGHGAQDTYTVVAESDTDNWQPIRIHVYKKEVERVFTECSKKVSTSPRIKESDTHECGHKNGITAARKETLLNVQIPAAVKLHADRLRVRPSEGNLVIKKLDPFLSPRVCRLFKIPEQHFGEGVPDTDFVLYVAIAMKAEHTKVCSEDNERRPTSAVMTILPKEIAATRHYIRLVAHNMAHALGFDFDRMYALGMVQKREDGKWWHVYVVNSTNTVKAVRDHYNCDTAVGMQIEKEQTLVKASHWERRVAKDELMSVFIGDVSGMFYTTLTLSVFSDMKFYKVNFSMAEPMSWGRNGGCKFLTDKCIQEGKNDYPDMFCTESTQALQCTSDRFALGRCTVRTFHQRLPERYRFFAKPNVGAPSSELMGHCPAIKPLASTACENGDSAQMPGSRLGPQSRCLKGKSLQLKNPPARGTSVGDICANVRCEGNKVMVQYKGDETWYKCPENGSIKPSAGSAFSGGEILCPKFLEVCTDPLSILAVDTVGGQGIETTEDSNESYDGEKSVESAEQDEDTPLVSVVQELPNLEKRLETKYTVVRRKGNDWQPIRIHVSAEAVDAAVKKCKEWADKATSKAIRGDTFLPGYTELQCPPPSADCSEATLITANMKSILVDKLLPAAIKLHSERLSVKPVQGSLTLQKFPFESGARCSFFQPPEGHFTVGVEGADFVLYVTTNTASSDSVKICSYDDEHRPVAAVKNFLPSEIGETRRLVRMAAHDIGHALGFDTQEMLWLKMLVRVRGKTHADRLAYFVKSPSTIEAVKKHYDCEEAETGMRLAMHSAEIPSPHWNNRIAKDELMGAYGDEGSGMFYTTLTLATFHDMKFYRANFSMAEPMSWGSKGGCCFLRRSCRRKNLKSYPGEFCKEEPNVLQCTSDRFGLGTCVQTNFSREVHGGKYLVAADFGERPTWKRPNWPVVQMSLTTACEGGDEELMPGSLLGAGSRCLTAELPDMRGVSVAYKSVRGICTNVTCENNTVKVQYKGSDSWHLCPENSSIELPSNTTVGGMKILCPKYSEVCSKELNSADGVVFKRLNETLSARTRRNTDNSRTVSTESGDAKKISESLNGLTPPPDTMSPSDGKHAMGREYFLEIGDLDSSTTTSLITSILALLCLAVTMIHL